MPEYPGGGLATAEHEPLNLPAVPGPGELEPEVVDAEIVEDGPDAAAPAVRQVIQLIRVIQPVQVIRVVQVAATSEPARAAARQGAYVTTGAAVVARRLWESRSTSRYERWLRTAEATGDMEKILDLEKRLAEFRRDRHARRMDWATLPKEYLLVLPKLAAGAGLILAVLGTLLAIATRRASGVAVPVEVLARVVEWAFIAVSAAWLPVLICLPWVVLIALWRAGRNAGRVPAWVATAADADMDVAIDERLLSQALDAMRIPQIRDYLKEGLPLQYVQPCREEGRGTGAKIRLPGVPAERIVRRRADFAAGVHRLAKEVWLTTGAEAAILDVWIADKGALEEGAGPYPLLDSGFADVFKGVPFGKTLRGDPVKAPLTGRNTICGGMPEQGKSSAARAIMCGAMLDVTAELRIYIPDVNFDFEVMKPRCSRYVMGAEDEHIEAILAELEDLKDEVQSRGQLLVDHEVPEVTRQLASAGIGLHPLFVLLEEAHVAIQHHKHGKAISGLLCDIVKLGRKRGIHMIVSTQAPTKDSMPRDVTRNCSNGIAFAVGDHVANDALLGQGAYRGGHRATDLIPGTDRGTALVKGFSGQRSETVQVYFLSVDKTSAAGDQVTPLVRRSLEEMARRGRALPGSGRERVIEVRDLLGDLDEVLGDERVRLRDLAGLLRGLAPTWGPYRTLTAAQLRKDLAAEDVRVINSSGTPYLDPADLRRVIADRSTEDLDEE